MKEAIDICYIATNGFAVRMLTQTDLLGKLKKSGRSVALICTDKNDPVISEYCRDRGIVLEEFDERSRLGSDNYMFKRKYFLEEIETNVALMEKHIFSTRFATSLHPVRRVRPYYYWMIYKLIAVFPSIRRRFIKRERKYLRSAKAQRLLNDLRPKKLISTYPVTYNEAVLLHHGNLSASTETWIHLLSWDNITCKGRWPELADRFIAWGPIMKEELAEHYCIEQRNIFECGVPHFDLHYSIKRKSNVCQYLQELSLNPNRPYIFVGMSSPRFAPGEIVVVEWLATEIELGKFGDIQLVVRPHPQNVTGNLADRTWLSRLERLSRLRSVAVDFPQLVKSKISWSVQHSDMIRLANLITGSTIVLNSGSTISIDALVHEKPVILTSFDGLDKFPYWRSARRLVDYPHLQKLCNTGGVDIVTSFPELQKQILAYLNSSNLNSTKRKAALFRHIVENDGKATERVIDILLK